MIFDPPAYSLRDFQRAHNLTFLQFHKLQEIGLTPHTILISEEAASEWRNFMWENYPAQGSIKIQQGAEV